MKICIAQTRPRKGDIERNIKSHNKLINAAISSDAELIIFPELSLTGYEPTLAKELATTKNDSRLDTFQTISDTNQITIGVGIPIQSDSGNKNVIGMVIFQPEKERQVNGKKYLHPDEEEYFVSGSHLSSLLGDKQNIALAICYELSIPAHSEKAHKAGAEVFIASVAKNESGIEKAAKELSEIASDYSMRVLMSNSVGECDDGVCAGQSSVWNERGEIIGQLNNTDEGIIILDTNSRTVTEKTM